MKAFFFFFLMLAPMLAAAEPPEKLLSAIVRNGTITVSDDIYSYTFRRDGVFRSVPVGLSGRCLDGTWSEQPFQLTLDTPPALALGHRIVVTARESWVNGIYPSKPRFYRIVYSLTDGTQQSKQRHSTIPGDLGVFYDSRIAVLDETQIDALPTK